MKADEVTQLIRERQRKRREEGMQDYKHVQDARDERARLRIEASEIKNDGACYIRH